MPNDKEHHIVERLAEESITEVLVGYRSYTLNIKRGLKEANEKCFGSADFDKGIISSVGKLVSNNAVNALEICSFKSFSIFLDSTAVSAFSSPNW